ncbi:uncharacterized protein C11orf24 homolog [Leptonychotes weddellii]|uniref:Uncharacterized protein C11orf24 homolog n=1 Tax=Leptonychotes weddellii TaxID=9713 RepID=A0A7F8RM21_LEPWE|nr:uncharacterized protein C11orf24 homolog [Leptonychotes weddellii]
MWTALVLVWISSLSLSESLVPIKDPRHSVLNETDNPDEKDASVMTVTRVLHGTSETMTAVTPSPVPLATASPAANASSPSVTAGSTLRTDDAGTEGAPDPVASRAPLPPASAAAGRTPPSATVSVPRVQVLSGSPLPGTAALTTLATSAQPAAGTTAGARSPSQHAPSNPTASPTPPSGPQAPNVSTQAPNVSTQAPNVSTQAPNVSTQAPNVSTQAPAVQASAAQPAAGTASGPMPTLSNSTSEPTRPPVASTAPAATIAVTGTTAPAQEPTTSTASAPAPHGSPTPRGEATPPTTRPSPAPSTRGAPGQVLPGTSPGPASTAPASGSPGGSKMPPTALCPLSSQGQYVVVTAKPLSPSLVNRGFLLAVLLLGVTLFIIVLVLLALQAYESYRKKEYTQVDYLINGMYADSEL